MGKVILICGKLAGGKSTYARELQKILMAVVLSVDEIMLALFGPDAGPQHDEYTARIKKLLLAKTAEISLAGPDVILDWGFWTREDRNRTRSYFRDLHIPCELHYIEISQKTWEKRIAGRNQAIAESRAEGYIVDQGLLNKFGTLFEEPSPDEIDVLVQS